MSYAEKMRRSQVAESAEIVAEALEHMENSILAQDEAVKSIGRITRNGMTDANASASRAEDTAEGAKSIAIKLRDEMRRLEEATVWGRVKWLMTGEIPPWRKRQ